MMLSSNCVSSTLADVFPSIPLHEPSTNATINGQLLNMSGLGGNVDAMSRIKCLGLNLPQLGQPHNGSISFFNEDRSRTNLIINYLPQTYTQDDLQRLFERVGPIRQCKLIKDKTTGASLCYGFVDFVNPQHAALAIQTYHGYETEHKRLRVAYASSGGRRFTPTHRVASLSGGVNSVSCLGTEVTNENVIGWEVFVVNIPLEWTEPDLLRLFTNFGNVILVRLLAPQLSDSPPSHKPRLNSPILNGDVGSECIDGGRVTTTASVIFEEKSSAEHSVLRLNGYNAAEWSAPLRLRIIGSVTRETYGLFCIPSRQSPALGPSRIPNSQLLGDPLCESEILNNLLNRKGLNVSHSASNSVFSKTLDSIGLSVSNDLNSHGSFNIQPRAIRSKVNDNAAIMNHNSFAHGHLELLDLLENQSNLSASNNAGILGIADRLERRDLSIANAICTQRSQEHDHPKLDSSRINSNHNHSPWGPPLHHSVLSALPDSNKGSDSVAQSWLTGGLKRLSIKSPLIPSPVLTSVVSQRGCQAHVWLKLENVQPTGSFKIRGMENACRKWSSVGVMHVVCPSGGNAAIAAAYCAQAYGLTCTLVVPETNEVAIRRRLSLEAPDARVVVHGSSWTEANTRAEQLVNEMNVTDSAVRLLHPFDNSDLWEGYEAIVDEVTSDIGAPDVVVFSVGGGGLLTGIIQGSWSRGWSSTHFIAIETEGADCLNRSMKAGHLVACPRANSIAQSLVSPTITNRGWSLAQVQSVSTVTCTDAEALDAVKHFLDEHGMLVEPASGAALSTIYSGVIARLQLEGRIPRPANVVIIVGGGRNVSLRQLSEWETQVTIEPVQATFLPSIGNPCIARSSPHVCTEMVCKPISANFGQLTQETHEKIRFGYSTPACTRASAHTVLNRTSSSDVNELPMPPSVVDRNTDVTGALNPHDLVNFSKLLSPSDADADEAELHDQ